MENYKYEKCPDCFGSAFSWKVDDGVVGDGLCDACGGSGLDNFLGRALEAFNPLKKGEPKCWTCKGRKKCLTCRGKGILKKKISGNVTIPRYHYENNDSKARESKIYSTSNSQEYDYSNEFAPVRLKVSFIKVVFWKIIGSILGSTMGFVLGFIIGFIVQIGSCTVIAVSTGKEPNDHHYAGWDRAPVVILFSFTVLGGIIGMLSRKRW